MHSLQVEFTGQKNEFALNLLMCKSVQTEGESDCVKAVNAECAKP